MPRFAIAPGSPQPFGAIPYPDGVNFSLLSAFVLERDRDQLTYELNDRPEWVIVPLHGILKAIDRPTAHPEPVLAR